MIRPLDNDVMKFIRAFDIASVCVDRDGRIRISRDSSHQMPVTFHRRLKKKSEQRGLSRRSRSIPLLQRLLIGKDRIPARNLRCEAKKQAKVRAQLSRPERFSEPCRPIARSLW
jgi:hypothetical protein